MGLWSLLSILTRNTYVNLFKERLTKKAKIRNMLLRNKNWPILKKISGIKQEKLRKCFRLKERLKVFDN